jgi:hypothetical protein
MVDGEEVDASLIAACALEPVSREDLQPEAVPVL